MSNDAKFWAARITLCIFLAFDLGLLAKIPLAAVDPPGSHLKLIIALFLLSLFLSLPATMYYYYAKSRRWETSQKDQEQIALETLVNLSKRQK